MLCPKCNRPVLDGARFCGSCGTAVDLGGGSPQETVIPPPSAAAAAMSAGASASWTGAASQLPGLFERIKNILLSPKTEWPVIELEPTSIAKLYTGYVIPLAALATLMSFVRMSVIGISSPFGGAFRTPALTGLVYALASFGFGLLGLYLVGLIINALAPTFSGERNQRQALKTAAYAFTPAWLGSVLGLLPAFATLLELAAGIYGIYLLYLGLPQLMRSPRDKAAGYTATVVICTILLGVVFGALSAGTGGFGSYGRFGGMHDPATREARQEQAAAAVGNMLGAALGTDEKGKQGLSAAINNLAQAGQTIEAQQNASANSGTQSAAPSNAATNTASGAVTADNAQTAVAATAGLMTAIGGALGGSRRVDPVDFHTLKAMLPDSLPGMQRTGAEGSSQQAMGVKGSSATANYQGTAGVRAEIKISDISGVSGLLDVAGAMVQNTNSESDTGYEKDTTLGGRPAHEKYDARSKHGEVGVIVAKRFAVDVTGDGVEMSTLEQYARSIDYARLEAMKDQGAQSR
jgi:Yip1-like protein/zinc ribbon protein